MNFVTSFNFVVWSGQTSFYHYHQFLWHRTDQGWPGKTVSHLWKALPRRSQSLGTRRWLWTGSQRGWILPRLQAMFWGRRYQSGRKDFGRQILRVWSQIERQCFYATISFWSLLLLFEIERAGMSQYCVDCRMRCAETSRQNWQLYSYPLKKYEKKTLPPKKELLIYKNAFVQFISLGLLYRPIIDHEFCVEINLKFFTKNNSCLERKSRFCAYLSCVNNWQQDFLNLNSFSKKKHVDNFRVERLEFRRFHKPNW